MARADVSLDKKDEIARFHYAEGNKFGLEFAKSLFLFNSALVVALIAYLAKGDPPHSDTKLWIERAIVAFWLAWFASLFVFVFGYLVNLYQGNSYRAPDPSSEQATWRFALGLGRMVYVVAAFVTLFVTVGFLCLLKAGGASR